jgi:hypothetical protein
MGPGAGPLAEIKPEMQRRDWGDPIIESGGRRPSYCESQKRFALLRGARVSSATVVRHTLRSRESLAQAQRRSYASNSYVQSR